MKEIIEPGYGTIDCRRIKCPHCHCIFIATDNEFDKTTNFPDPLSWSPSFISSIQYSIECPSCNYNLEMPESVFKSLPIETKRIPFEKK